MWLPFNRAGNYCAAGLRVTSTQRDVTTYKTTASKVITTALCTTLLRVVQLLRYDSQLVHDMYIRVLSMVGPVPPATRNRAWEGYDVSELEPRGGV